jgi:FkbM family methyltransferase
MKLRDLRIRYEDGQIDKQSYIQQAYQSHEGLFDYAEFLADTNISQIRIVKGRVLFTFADTGVELAVGKGDTRAAPIDTLNFTSYESQEIRMLARLVAPGATVLDVGANIGWFALSLSRFIADVTVHCFEPIPATFELLANNIELNRAPTVIAHNFGLSESPGKAQFYCDPLMSVNASMRDLSGQASGNVAECRLSTVDTFVKEHQVCVDLLKCDVEGAELLVLRGGPKTLQEFQPILFVEMLRKWSAKFGYHPNDIISYLSEFGYNCFMQIGDDLKIIEAVTSETTQTNFFFLHRDKHAHIKGGV